MTDRRCFAHLRINVRVLENLASRYSGMQAISIDGGTASGKTTLASHFESLCAIASKDAQVIRVDWFLRPRASRLHLYRELQAGMISMEEYHNRTWDLDRYDACIGKIRSSLMAGRRQMILLDGVADRRSGESDARIEFDLAHTTMLILEGTGVLHPDRSSLPGPKIWIESPPVETIIERKFNRALDREPSITRLQVAKKYHSSEASHDAWIRNICRDRAEWLYKSGSLVRRSLACTDQ